ncbi:MAG: archease, partial [Candidatus Poseidoniia archaeon]|nr:archease [Candidatus Poseidoniia archaeon]
MREIFEHTADAGIRVESPTLSEAFNEVSLAFTEIVTGGSLPNKKTNFKIEIKATTLDSLLVNYISHLIYLFDTENFLVSSAVITVKTESCTISGTLEGDFYDE